MSSSAAAAVAGKPLLPIAACGPGSRRGKWQPVGVCRGVVCVTGGFNKTPCNVASVEYKVGNTTQVFVQLEKNSHWFLKGVGGPGAQKGDLKAVQVLEDIRHNFEKVTEAAHAAESAVAGEGPAAVAEAKADSQAQDQDVDPMDALDEVEEELPKATATLTPTKSRTRKAEKVNKFLRAEVQQLEMPTRPACAGRSQDGTTFINVYRKSGASARNFGNLYLQVDSLDWLLSYAADELHFQGVTCCESPPPAPNGN